MLLLAQAPNGSHAMGAGSGPRAASAGDLDRAISLTMPDMGHRGLGGPGAARRSEDGLMAAAREGAQSLKRKSDTGRYCMTKTEKRLVTDSRWASECSIDPACCALLLALVVALVLHLPP